MKNVKEKEKKKWRGISLVEYLMFVTMIFMLSGIMLFLYCKISNIDVGNLIWYTDPLLFLGIGITCFFMFIGQKFGHVFDKALRGDI